MKLRRVSLILALSVGLALSDATIAKADDSVVVLEGDESNVTEDVSQVLITASEEAEIAVYDIPNYKGMKKWMDYKLFGKKSDQYKLQQLATTDANGLRQINGCYCVAIGSRFNTSIGQRFDLILQNGIIIPCVMADQKADEDTDSTNTFSIGDKNPCCSEFVISYKQLTKSIKKSGDISSAFEIWGSPVEKIVTYDINLLADDIIE